jgi:hypothetical protein
LNELDDFTKLIVAPACGHALEKATKLVATFPEAVLTTTTPLSSTKSLIFSSWELRLTVRMELEPEPELLLFGLLLLVFPVLLLEGVVASSLEQACIMQLMQVRVSPPVILLMKVLRFMTLQQTTMSEVQIVIQSFKLFKNVIK